MPRGINRSGNFSSGTPVTLPKNFGNVIDLTTKDFGNKVTWLPSPDHFGNVVGGGPSNTFGFLLEDGSGIVLLEDGTILLLENQA